jgi:phosphonate transport system substrate-binding protein
MADYLTPLLRKRLLLALLLAALFAPNAKAEEALQFGVISTMETQTLLQIWGPLADDMSSAVGIPIRIQICDDYAGVIWAMEAGRIQIAAMGNKSAIEAVDRAGGEVAFRKVDLEGTDGYWSHIITRTDSGLESIEDLFSRAADITFGNGDPNSTSGFVVPGYYLFARNGLEPQRTFKRVIHANHQENLFALVDGQLDAVTSNSIQLKRLEASHPEKFRQIKVLWTSPLIPSDPIVWRKSLSEKTKAAIDAFLLDYGRPAPLKSTAQLDYERTVLGRITISGFIASDNRQLIPIRELELFRLRSLIEGDASIAAEQRSSKLRDIENKLQRLREETCGASR